MAFGGEILLFMSVYALVDIACVCPLGFLGKVLVAVLAVHLLLFLIAFLWLMIDLLVSFGGKGSLIAVPFPPRPFMEAQVGGECVLVTRSSALQLFSSVTGRVELSCVNSAVFAFM